MAPKELRLSEPGQDYCPAAGTGLRTACYSSSRMKVVVVGWAPDQEGRKVGMALALVVAESGRRA